MTHLSRMESNKSLPSPVLGKEISKALGVDNDVIEILSSRIPSGMLLKWQRSPEKAAAYLRALKF